MSKAIWFALFVAGAFAAWGLWLAEVCWVKGWAGLAWLSGFNWSALPICALIAIMASYMADAHAEWSRRVNFVAAGWVVCLASFAVARWAAFDLFSRVFPSSIVSGAALALLMAGVAVSVGLTIFANRWLAPLHYWTAILVGVGLLLVLPLSFATIKAFPALNGSVDQIHSIKMGYPVFWTALLVPAAMRLGRKRS